MRDLKLASAKSTIAAQRLHRDLRLRYLVALAFVGLLVTASSISLNYVVSTQAGTSNLVRVSDEQRDLVFKAAALSEQIAAGTTNFFARSAIDDLERVINTLEANHLALMSGNRVLGLPSTKSSVIRGFYFDEPHNIDKNLSRFLDSARRLIAQVRENDVDPLRADLFYMRHVINSSLPESMAGLVQWYRMEGEQIIQRALFIERVIWLTTLFLLVLMAVLVFEPMVRSLRNSFATMRTQMDDLLDANENLQRLREQERVVSENLPGIVFRSRVEKNGAVCVDYIKGDLQGLYGIAADEAISDVGNIRAAIHPDDRDDFLKSMYSAVAEKKDWHYIYRIKPSGQEERWARVMAHTLPVDDNVTYLHGMVLDITEQKKIEGALRMAKETAEASEQSKAAFLASMSHEIRTPMTGIQGLADLLLDEDLTTDQRQNILHIKTATTSLLRILNDILDLSKLDAGKVEIENIDFDLTSLLDEVTGLLYRRAEESGLYMRVEIDNSVSSSLNGDPTRLRQILLNLLGNAIKFTKTGGVSLFIGREDKNPHAPSLFVEVVDTGIGFAGAMSENVFGEFTQADSSISRRYEGTGLGLAICRRLVTLLKGQIGAESKIGEGSRFWFKIPYTEAKSRVYRKTAKTSSTTYEATRKLRILLAEDNALNRKIIHELLCRYGHQMDFAEDGLEAIRKHREKPYDLILMDVRMPEVSGPEATKWIRQAEKAGTHTPIIAVTADAMIDNLKTYLNAGMDAIVAKPVEIDSLLATINDVLGEEVHVPSVSPSSEPEREAKLSAKVKKGSFEVPDKLEEELAFLERAVNEA